MIRNIVHKLRTLLSNGKTKPGEQSNKIKPEDTISANLKKNLEKIKESFGNSSDFNIREFSFGTDNEIDAAIFFIDGLVDKKTVNESIMAPLMKNFGEHFEKLHQNKKLYKDIQKKFLSVAEIKEVNLLREVLDGVLTGNTVLLIDGNEIGLQIGTIGWENRGVQEPATESVVRGPREGFTETLRINTSLLRRKIKSENLMLETMKVGKMTKTTLCVAYIRGLANDKIVKEVKQRIKGIEIDGVLESGYVEQLIEDGPYSIFPTVGNSEKPDIVAAKLLEGRVAIITEGTPIVLTVPYLFAEALMNSEDYYSRPWLTSLIRWIRYLSLILTVFLPGLYISAQNFHHEMIPTNLLITIASARKGIPFPVFVEILLMGLFFEILREAGVRLPRPIGQAVSIVGALVLGEAAVNAGFFSSPAVLVTAMAGIAGFVIPAQNDSVTISRFVFAFMAAISGLYGVLLGFIIVLIHLTTLRSFGVPYFSPFISGSVTSFKDVFVRVPWWAMKKRPHFLRPKNLIRLGDNQIPEPPEEEK